MSIARIGLSYEAGKVVNDLSKENWNYLAENVPTLGLLKWEGEERPPWFRYGEDIYIDMETDGPILAQHKIPFQVKGFKNTFKAPGRDVNGNTTIMNIALPNIALLAIDEVTWMDDACTEALQDKLSDGWRILAICPPNGTRRPDYILGRTKTF